MTTIADVARHAGVSVATVSHVMNRTRHVEPETAELHVQRAVLPAGAQLHVWSSARAASTRDMLAAVRDWKARAPARFSRIMGAARRGAEQAVRASCVAELDAMPSTPA